MTYEPLHHKYRPQTFGDLVGQQTIALTLNNALEQAKIAPAYLFTGPRGTGKTSSARILAKSLNCLASEQPTPHPCGKCEACLAIAKGSALDVMEIDAASNTGVDNIREIIERSRFAPVQCRYKIYAIDECLTGESLIQTNKGLMRINNPDLEGKKVLSYNENTNKWEHKKVLRWLERGTKKTLTIKTGNYQISCTENHLIRTETGWIEAGLVKEGMKILSPVNVDAVLPSTNMELMASNEDLLEDINLKEINTEQSLAVLAQSSNKQKQYSLDVNADVKKNSIFPIFSKKAEELRVSNFTRTSILIKLENLLRKNTITSKWEQNPAVNGYQTYSNIQSPQWNTSLERVESVSHAATCEKVYDLEVEDNHNFVANGLLVHNCHMLSTAAFNALLKTLEEPPPQVVFILATTDPQRVLSTIISRCQRFDYRRIPLAEMTNHLRYIADRESIKIAEDALTLVAQISNGGLRDAESLLDQLSLLPETISVEKVWDLVGAVPEQDLLKLLQAINGNDSLAVLQQCRSLLDRGREPLVVLQNLATFYLNLLIAKTAPQHAELTAVTETCWQELCAEAENWQTPLILRGQQHLKEAETQLKRTTQPRLWLEVTLLGLLPEAASSIKTQAQTVVPTSPKQVVTPLPTVIITPPATAQNTQTAPATPVENPVSPANPSPQPPLPQTTQSPPPQVAKQNPEPQTTAVTHPPTAERTDLDSAANQQIWNQVVSCLQPPTTQALLKQQCYLVNFDGMSAVVGVSSANLEKMTQQKIPNIEAAFAQVCQRKVGVQIEVASSKKNTVNNSSTTSIGTAIAQTLTPQQSTSSSPPPVEIQKSVQRTKSAAISANSVPVSSPLPSVLQATPAKTFDRSSQTNHQLQPVATQNTSVLASTVAGHVPVDNNAVQSDSFTAESTLNEDYDNNLQQAIDSLTQSFEGEVVQLDNNLDLNDLDDDFDEEDISSISEAIPLDRPNVDEYDDDW